VRLRQRFAEILPNGSSVADRVRALARMQDDLGYLSEAVVEGDEIRLVEHNCAVIAAALASPAACQAELELFRGVLGTEVVRETTSPRATAAARIAWAPPRLTVSLPRARRPRAGPAR